MFRGAHATDARAAARRRAQTTRTMRATLLLVALAGADAAIELTKDNFQKEVKESGKNAFVKFLAPW